MDQSIAASGSERPNSAALVEPARNVNAVQASEKMNGDSRAQFAGAEEAGSRSGINKVLLGTFVLGLIAWVVTLLSQAIVAAKISNASVRILWFGMIIQTLLTVLVLQVITKSAAYNSAYAYGTQISIFAAIATVFAVIGVDQNIYSSNLSQQATGAGWLLVALVDLLWILLFTSPPQAPIMRLTSSFGQRSVKQEHHENKVEKITRSTDAFSPPPHTGGAMAGEQSHPRGENRQRTGSGQWSGYTPPPQVPGGRGTMMSVSSEHNRSALVEPREGSALGSGAPPSQRPFSGSTAAASGPDEQRMSHATNPDLTASTVSDSAAKWRAEAKFEYNATDDPNELSFKKGEVLLIFDKSGKWWEAKTKDGRRGIAPSNYLQLL